MFLVKGLGIKLERCEQGKKEEILARSKEVTHFIEIAVGGLGPRKQTTLCNNNKVRPINAPLTQELTLLLKRPLLSRNPYDNPSTLNPPQFRETGKTTWERLEICTLELKGWLSKEESKAVLHVSVLGEGTIAYSEKERGTLKREYGLPYAIPIVPPLP
ncbi:hypothetical protein CROQUDRAFT_134646 [Cronartium quercuum f. sp. fusiforme G11]|uniref:Uncharacterized protein n=1 Tax=Cronartium quercuum f. sp. fusiforme G11 TaxID=708437 RepID=A0A9P6T9A9_9BASI|nr:hypothetical protein CROQUDRAFT_134646 [Cronartium quercuum f. sp. fusiforme G11]